MSFFQRMLASVGIGAAKVDTRLETPRLRPGDEVRGTVFIRGGSVEQRIDGIYLQLMTRYIVEKDDHKIPQTGIIGKFRITEPLVVRPGETIDLPFSFVLPLDTPTTRGGTPVWLKTGLDIDNAVDPTDHDHIEVDPHPYAQAVLDAVQSLGFRLRKAQCEYASRLGGRLPFVQEFEFAPPPAYRGRLEELELVFFLRPTGVDVWLEIDRRARGLLGMLESALELDERMQRLSFDEAELRDPRTVAHRLRSAIDAHMR